MPVVMKCALAQLVNECEVLFNGDFSYCINAYLYAYI